MLGFTRPVDRALKYFYWDLMSRIGSRISAPSDRRATALLTYFSPARMRHADTQLRQLLRCDFIDSIVVSNHNPDLRIEDVVRLRDPRVTFRNETTKRGCGHRWEVANSLSGSLFLVIDDDLLLYPSQLRRVFTALTQEPQRPHGLAGMVYRDSTISYEASRDREVDFLCELYAVTREHIERYHALRRMFADRDAVMQAIDRAADFVVISRAGCRRPRIHDVGTVFRCETFAQAGTAVHKTASFEDEMAQVIALVGPDAVRRVEG